MSLHYELSVNQGQVAKESGYFFLAMPFDIMTPAGTVSCEFKKGSKGKVVYRLLKDNQLIVELEHSDYAPDCEPDSLTTIFPAYKDVMKPVFAALVKLGVTINRVYKAAFSAEDNTVSYEVRQVG